MSVAALFLGLGFTLMAVLLLLFVQHRNAERVSNDLLGANLEIASCFAETPPRELTDRVFGPEDWKFVESQSSERNKYVFLRQRRDLALAWMEVLRRSTKQIMGVHRAAARTSPQLEPLVELRVTLSYLAFLLLWQFLALAIWIRGPVGLRNLTRNVDRLSRELRDTISNLFPQELHAPDQQVMSSLTK